MSKKGGDQPSGNTTSTQTSTPWSAQQPYLEQSMAGAQDLYKNYTPQYFGGSTVAPFNLQQQQGLNAINQYGISGAPGSGVGASGNYLNNLEGGQYLGANPENSMLSPYTSGEMMSAGNPFFQNMVGQLGQSIAPQVDSHFAANGRYGSGANANAFASALTNQAGQMAYQNYNQGQQNQLAAAGQVGQNYNTDQGNMLKGAAVAPGIQQAQFDAYGQALNAGNQIQQQQQGNLTDQVNRFNFQQQLPYNKLGNFENMIQGNYGGSSTLSQPYFQNKGANALGGALGGSALGGMVSGGSSTGKGLGALGGLALM